MDRHVLFRELPDGLRRRLPESLHEFTYKPQGSLAQVHFGEPRIHYEVWFHWRTGRVELGLHFERDERTNEQLFDLYDRHIVELKATLGESIELERWDKGWTRIYETWPCERVDRTFRSHLLDRLAAIIAALEPIRNERSSAGE
jgi:hypothetical protein